jgi:hypothetical protein
MTVIIKLSKTVGGGGEYVKNVFVSSAVYLDDYIK